MSDAALWAGSALAAAAAGGALVLRDPRQRAAAMALALALAPVLIAADNWDDERFRDLRDSPALLALIAVLGASLLVAIAALLRRLPEALPLLAFAALPFRIPVESGGQDANLLLPLYAVIAAGVLAELWRVVRPIGPASPESEPRPSSGYAANAARWLPAALAAWLLLYAVQGAYSDDLSKAVENIAFFLVPFAVLAALLLRVEWTPRLLTLLLAVIVGEAVLFAVVGFAQYAVRELFWNDAIIAANEIHSYFRVNSLFWDPNIFGRYLALTLIAVAAVMLWTRSARHAGAAGLLALVLLAALAITFSQSSLIALLAGLTILAGLRWSARWTAAACVVIAVAGLAVIAVSDRSVQTSGRDELIEGGLDLAEERPVWGYGSGSFRKEFERQAQFGDGSAEAVSHTEPVTVAAEQGAIGLVAYLAVIGMAIAALAHGIRPGAPGIRGGGGALATEEGLVVAIARSALLAGVVAMVVHSLSYAAFFTDPITWALIAVGLALARRG
jgi:putative inorganic carbon (hco3(-)) transporter